VYRLRSLVERLPRRPYRRTPPSERSTVRAEVDAPAVVESERWNQLIRDGWVARWRPTTYSRRRDCMWVRRQGHELLVFPGSEDRPRVGNGPHFRLKAEPSIESPATRTGRLRCRGWSFATLVFIPARVTPVALVVAPAIA
jgi:hypothetical protein